MPWPVRGEPTRAGGPPPGGPSPPRPTPQLVGPGGQGGSRVRVGQRAERRAELGGDSAVVGHLAGRPSRSGVRPGAGRPAGYPRRRRQAGRPSGSSSSMTSWTGPRPSAPGWPAGPCPPTTAAGQVGGEKHQGPQVVAAAAVERASCSTLALPSAFHSTSGRRRPGRVVEKAPESSNSHVWPAASRARKSTPMPRSPNAAPRSTASKPAAASAWWASSRAFCPRRTAWASASGPDRAGRPSRGYGHPAGRGRPASRPDDVRPAPRPPVVRQCHVRLVGVEAGVVALGPYRGHGGGTRSHEGVEDRSPDTCRAR